MHSSGRDGGGYEGSSGVRGLGLIVMEVVVVMLLMEGCVFAIDGDCM